MPFKIFSIYTYDQPFFSLNINSKIYELLIFKLFTFSTNQYFMQQQIQLFTIFFLKFKFSSKLLFSFF